MKKRRAVLLFGGLVLMLAGYVAFSTRAIYLSPRIDWGEEIGKRERRLVKRWIRRNRVEYHLTPTADLDAVWFCLRHPYRTKPTRLGVRKERGVIYIRNDWMGYLAFIELREEGGNWVSRELTWEQSEYLELTW